MQYNPDNNINLNKNIMKPTSYKFNLKTWFTNQIENNEENYDPDFFTMEFFETCVPEDMAKAQTLIIRPNNVPDKENVSEFNKYWDLYNEMLNQLYMEFRSMIRNQNFNFINFPVMTWNFLATCSGDPETIIYAAKSASVITITLNHYTYC